ncbi:hypothetical protein [Mesoplasma photuris]|uniref:hypothetical protein n=1 Tax=Mesoplasma photuris TaxID=217731 RepID=UPI0004E14AA6|nr:hypothetical protein [Mesoplasma photuris]
MNPNKTVDLNVNKNGYLNAEEYEGVRPVSALQKNKLQKINYKKRIKKTLALKNSSSIKPSKLKSEKTSGLPTTFKIGVGNINPVDNFLDDVYDEINQYDAYLESVAKCPECSLSHESFVEVEYPNKNITVMMQETNSNFYNDLNDSFSINPKNDEEAKKVKYLSNFYNGQRKADKAAAIFFSLALFTIIAFILIKLLNQAILGEAGVTGTFLQSPTGGLNFNINLLDNAIMIIDYICNIFLITILPISLVGGFISLNIKVWIKESNKNKLSNK